MLVIETNEPGVAEEMLLINGNRNVEKMRRQKRQVYEAAEYGLDMWKDHDSTRYEVVCEAN